MNVPTGTDGGCHEACEYPAAIGEGPRYVVPALAAQGAVTR